MISSLRDQISRIEGMKDALYDDKLAGYISAEKYEHKFARLDAQKRQTEDRLNKIYEAEEINKPRCTELMHENPIVDLYLGSNPAQKRIIIREVFRQIVTHNETIALVRK